MGREQKHTAEVVIGNRLGFHVRPVQRFAAFARVFNCDVEVSIGERTVPGKSVINLVSLGGRRGDAMTIAASGEDAEQAVKVLEYLARERFFVEDELDPSERPQRHLERLSYLASCFRSDIRMKLGRDDCDAKKLEELCNAGLDPADEVRFEAEGEDAEQALALLENLASACFYLEDRMADKTRKVS